MENSLKVALSFLAFFDLALSASSRASRTADDSFVAFFFLLPALPFTTLLMSTIAGSSVSAGLDSVHRESAQSLACWFISVLADWYSFLTLQ